MGSVPDVLSRPFPVSAPHGSRLQDEDQEGALGRVGLLFF